MKHQRIIAGMLLLGAPSLFAQSYFDDDIYYNPNKDKTEKAAQRRPRKNRTISPIWLIWTSIHTTDATNITQP